MAADFPLYWRCAATALDCSLRKAFEAQRETPLKLGCFLRKHRGALSLWGDPDDVQAAIDISPQFADIPGTISRLTASCSTLKVMFKSCALVCARADYRQSVRAALAVLEGEDFAPEYTERFRKIADEGALQLREEGHKRCKNKFEGEVVLAECQVPMVYVFAGDESDTLFWARVKTIVANSQQRPLFP